MKNTMMKFAGLFVEKVPVDEPGAGSTSTGPAPSKQRPSHPMEGHFPSPSGHVAVPGGPQVPGAPAPAPHAGVVQQLAVALRAWVPQEYAGYLAPFGLHVIAAGGELGVEQAIGWGANVLIISAECLGSHTHLLVHPQLPTVFVTPQPVTLPDVAGVVQVQEPLHASEISAAAREAVQSWTAGRA